MSLFRSLWRWIAASSTPDRPAGASRRSDRSRHDDRDDEYGAPPSPERRRFLARISLVSGGIATLVAGVPVVGVLVSPLLRRDTVTWRAVGAVDDFRVGEIVKVSFLDPQPLPWAGFAGRSAAWLRRDGSDQFTAFSIYCTHTGCPVAWHSGARLFLCPCHGGAFYQDGAVASGPPPSPLARLPVQVRDGQVEVGASVVPLPPALEGNLPSRRSLRLRLGRLDRGGGPAQHASRDLDWTGPDNS